MLTEVSKQTFWGFVMGTKRNVHPTPHRDHSVWRDQHSGELIGKSMPGWSTEGAEKYLLSESLVGGGEHEQPV